MASDAWSSPGLTVATEGESWDARGL